MEKAIEVLNEVKESIINAYASKSGLSHARIANLMFTERQNDEYPYQELASQADFDRF